MPCFLLYQFPTSFISFRVHLPLSPPSHLACHARIILSLAPCLSSAIFILHLYSVSSSGSGIPASTSTTSLATVLYAAITLRPILLLVLSSISHPFRLICPTQTGAPYIIILCVTDASSFLLCELVPSVRHDSNESARRFIGLLCIHAAWSLNFSLLSLRSPRYFAASCDVIEWLRNITKISFCVIFFVNRIASDLWAANSIPVYSSHTIIFSAASSNSCSTLDLSFTLAVIAISSAYAMSSTLSGICSRRRLSYSMFQMVGPNTQPCRTPTVIAFFTSLPSTSYVRFLSQK